MERRVDCHESRRKVDFLSPENVVRRALREKVNVLLLREEKRDGEKWERVKWEVY